MIVYRGVILENAKTMLTEGPDTYFDSIWNISDPDMLYFYSLEAVKTEEGISDDSDAAHRCIECALENAFLSAALLSKANHIVVFRFDIPDELLCLDDSCNMPTSVQCSRLDVKPEHIKQIFVANFAQKYRLLYLTGVNLDLLNPYLLSDIEYEMIGALGNVASNNMEYVFDYIWHATTKERVMELD